ncbi:YcaO-like family protein [Pseudomonas sp. P39-UII1]|uniref:YcaO-like family protein n=1 Tax=Pseudomonas sp. P39-UII1 TaxID=3080333 RepID=UPI00320ACEE4
MNTYNEIHHASQADFQLIRPNAITQLPHSVECGSRWRTYGSSSGWSSDVQQSALGEHFERKHFYLDIPVNDKNRLSDSLTPQECGAFEEALSQTSTGGLKTPLHLHLFDRTTVYRITDFTQCKVPTACISISECRDPIDNGFYPMRDTCGCSAHVSVEKAMLGALKENLERQFLLRCWLTKTCTEQIGYNAACSILANSASLTLFKELKKTGELCILDLTDKRLPGNCILLCYGNQTADAKVKYCAGMAYAATAGLALEKSIIELWQTFRFMLSVDSNHESESDLQDPYLKHFLACNRYDTYRNITTCSELENPKHRKRCTTPLTTQSLIHTIRDLGFNGYLYLSSTPFKQSHLHLCKYFSPNLFLHMNNAKNFNTHNIYSKPFRNDIIPSQSLSMVPFP